MKSNEKGLNSGVKDPDAYVNAYSYEEIANILFGKWALIINNLCILFYLFSCQCSYMTLIKVKKYNCNFSWGVSDDEQRSRLNLANVLTCPISSDLTQFYRGYHIRLKHLFHVEPH